MIHFSCEHYLKESHERFDENGKSVILSDEKLAEMEEYHLGELVAIIESNVDVIKTDKSDLVAFLGLIKSLG